MRLFEETDTYKYDQSRKKKSFPRISCTTHINKSKSQNILLKEKKQVTEEVYYKIQITLKNRSKQTISCLGIQTRVKTISQQAMTWKSLWRLG